MSQQCLECRFYSMWEGNCCFPGKNFMHVACDDATCSDYEPEEVENGSGSDNCSENAV